MLLLVLREGESKVRMLDVDALEARGRGGMKLVLVVVVPQR